jgi:hypothetical protein
MTNEERDIISQFIARVGGAPAPPGFAAAGSVPATQAAPLPPVDQDANALIGQMFQRYPEVAYRMTQLAFVQEQGLIQAQNRIAEMDAELHRTRQALQQAQQQPPQQSGGFFGNLFGGGAQRAAPPPPNPGPWAGQPGMPPQGGPQGYAPPPPGYAQPPPQYAPGYQPGMFQRGGSGFLGSALTTAAGVAGGMVVGGMLSNMLTGGHHTDGGWGGQSGGMSGGPWGGSPAVTDQGAWDSSGGAAAPSNQDYVDNGSWDQQPAQDASWSDSSSSGDSGGGSWDSSGGDSGGGGGGSDDSF